MIGEYRVIRELGRGGMALVLEGVRERDKARHAIKLMLPLSRGTDAATRFDREFRALSLLDHPNVLKVHGAGVYEGRPYFSMELLDGRDLRDQVDGWRAMPPARRFELARDVLLQLARALEYIHDRGWVHRDITPSNIMLLPDGRVKLMDFGVVKEPGAELTVAGEVVGTVAYIAPEQIRGGQIDARADLYSLGAVLYFMLTGRRPFNARTLAGYLDKHLNRAPRPPHELAPTVPRDLDAICLRLLEKEPSQRFASARHLLYTLGAERPALSAAGPPARLLTGRPWERACLREAVALLDAGKSGVVIIEGDSGMGCSRLVSEGMRLTRQLGLPVIWSQNQTPTQPAFLGLREVYRALSADTPPPPALAKAFEGADREDRADLYAVCAGFRELLAAAAPLLLCIEDIDRADRGTLEVVEYLVRNLEGQPVLFLLSRRPPAGADPLEAMRERDGLVHLALSPLPASAVEEMVLHHVDSAPEARALAERLHRDSEGNPFIIEQMLRGLREAGVIDQRAVTMSVAELHNAPLPVPRSIREALEKRLRVLSPDALGVARLIGFARQQVDADLLRLASDLEAPALAAALQELVAAELLRKRQVGDTERYELLHLRLQDVLIDGTPVVAQRALHRRLGLSLEQLNRHHVDPIVELLAYHFDEAGASAKAYAYMVWAAEKLQKQAFTTDALRFLDRAVELEPQTREYMTLVDAEKRRADVLLRRANALYHLGKWDASVAVAREADGFARGLEDDRLLARTATELARQARAMSAYDEASAELARALRHAEAARDPRLQIVPLCEEGAMRWGEGDLDGAAERLEEALKLSERYGDGRGLALGANGLGVLAMCKGRSAEARRYFDKTITVCEEHGLMERLAIARTNLAELSHCMGNIRKGLTLADRTITASREVDHRYGVSIGLRYRALLLGDLGRWAEAEENACEAVKLQQRLGNRDEELASTVALTRVVIARDDTARAAALLDRCLELAGDFDTEGFLPVVRAWRSQRKAMEGDLDGALAELVAAEGEGHNWPHQRLRQQLNAARAWRLVGQRPRAAAIAEEALRLAETCGYRYYAMRARQILVNVHDNDAANSRHRRIAEALARSLAAALPPEDATSFLTQQGLEARTHQRRRLRTRS